jgi:hypothetical protein
MFSLSQSGWHRGWAWQELVEPWRKWGRGEEEERKEAAILGLASS